VGRPIEGDALTALDKALGLTGKATAVAELQDATLEQVIDVSPVVRRSRSLAGSQGIIYGVLQNVHAGSGTLVSVVNPLLVDTADVVAPYPTPMPPELDVWYLGCTVVRDSGTGTFEGLLEIQDTNAGWGRDDSGGPVTAVATRTIVAVWSAIRASAGAEFGTLGGQLQAYDQNNAMRIPRGGTPVFAFRSNASAIATYACFIRLGIFPSSLGQDAAV